MGSEWGGLGLNLLSVDSLSGEQHPEEIVLPQLRGECVPSLSLRGTRFRLLADVMLGWEQCT